MTNTHPAEHLDLRQGRLLTEAIASLQNIIARDRADNYVPFWYEMRRDHIIAVAERLTDLIGNLDEPLNSLARLIRHPDTDLDIALNSIAMVYNEQPDGFNKLVLEDAMELICGVIEEINHPVKPTLEEGLLARIVGGRPEGLSILSGYESIPASVEAMGDPDHTYAKVLMGIDGTHYVLLLRKVDE